MPMPSTKSPDMTMNLILLAILSSFNHLTNSFHSRSKKALLPTCMSEMKTAYVCDEERIAFLFTGISGLTISLATIRPPFRVVLPITPITSSFTVESDITSPSLSNNTDMLSCSSSISKILCPFFDVLTEFTMPITLTSPMTCRAFFIPITPSNSLLDISIFLIALKRLLKYFVKSLIVPWQVELPVISLRISTLLILACTLRLVAGLTD